MKRPAIDYGVARFTLPGEGQSGDDHLFCCHRETVLIAAIDGIGHGVEAANAARAACSVLSANLDRPIISLVEECHQSLRSTRGVALSLASIDTHHGLMTWLGVGNIQGVLVRSGAGQNTPREFLLLRGGVVGAHLPSLRAAVVPVNQGDTLVFATDGIRNQFMDGISLLDTPQRSADRILERYHSGKDDALVVVARIGRSKQ